MFLAPRHPRAVQAAPRGIPLAITLLLALGIATAPVAAQASPLVSGTSVTSSGCGMAHCDPQLSDQSTVPAPSALNSSATWHDTSVQGSKYGLGCASNGTMFVCTFSTNGATPTVVAYNSSGQHLWSSSALDSFASDSAPLILSDGTVLATDNQYLAHFSPTGQLLWKMPTAGGVPISPNLTASNLIILATDGGPISAYSLATGALLGRLTIAATLSVNGKNVSGYFDTTNSPTVSGNRVYLSTQFVESGSNQDTTYGRLYAIDVSGSDQSGSATFTPAWYYQFKAPSGASPLFVQDGSGSYVYFDGNGSNPSGPSTPEFFAVKDLGTFGQLTWSFPLSAHASAAGAQDPRGGVWVYADGNPILSRLDFDTGAVLQTVNLASLVQTRKPLVPTSAMTISGSPTLPRMIVAAKTNGASVVDVLAINLSSSTLLWSNEVDQGLGVNSVPMGQFPTGNSATGKPVVVFTTNQNGVWGLVGS